ncbi:MAG: trigger factor, partial [bacterium]|nr:trigger factor [bacterium]
LFDALAKKENIVATPEDAEKRLEEVAQSTGQSVAVLKRTYQSRNLIPQLQESLRAEKTLDFVLKAAKIKTKD